MYTPEQFVAHCVGRLNGAKAYCQPPSNPTAQDVAHEFGQIIIEMMNMLAETDGGGSIETPFDELSFEACPECPPPSEDPK